MGIQSSFMSMNPIYKAPATGKRVYPSKSLFHITKPRRLLSPSASTEILSLSENTAKISMPLLVYQTEINLSN